MKRIIAVLLIAICLISLAGCGQTSACTGSNANTEVPYTGAPKIEIDGNSYYATALEILNELPDGYEEAGELTQEQLKYASILGNKYYADPNNQPLTEFYVYQECGTPAEDGGVDNSKRQWAYVHWTLRE